MKTNLPIAITTVEEAKAFLTELHKNGEHFHPEDDAFDVLWDGEQIPTLQEQGRLNCLIMDIYNLPGNDGRHSAPMVFDPCEFLNELDRINKLDEEAYDLGQDDDEVTFEELREALTSAIKFIKFNHQGDNRPIGLKKWEELL